MQHPQNFLGLGLCPPSTFGFRPADDSMPVLALPVHETPAQGIVLPAAAGDGARPHDAPSGGFGFFVGRTIGLVRSTPVAAAASTGSTPASRSAFRDLARPETSAA